MKTTFITGTDTEIGKTVAACALVREWVARGERVAALKPIASGCARTPEGLRNEDALALMEAANVSLGYGTVNPYAFEPAIAPHLAARQAGVSIDIDKVAETASMIEADRLVVEGVGGWCVPLDNQRLLPEMVRPLTRQVILVVGLRLGCINHALLTARQIERDGFELAGWIGNSCVAEMACREENITTLRDEIDAPLLALLPHVPPPTPGQTPRPRAQWSGLAAI